MRDKYLINKNELNDGAKLLTPSAGYKWLTAASGDIAGVPTQTRFPFLGQHTPLLPALVLAVNGCHLPLFWGLSCARGSPLLQRCGAMHTSTIGWLTEGC